MYKFGNFVLSFCFVVTYNKYGYTTNSNHQISDFYNDDLLGY